MSAEAEVSRLKDLLVKKDEALRVAKKWMEYNHKTRLDCVEDALSLRPDQKGEIT